MCFNRSITKVIRFTKLFWILVAALALTSLEKNVKSLFTNLSSRAVQAIKQVANQPGSSSELQNVLESNYRYQHKFWNDDHGFNQNNSQEIQNMRIIIFERETKHQWNFYFIF